MQGLLERVKAFYDPTAWILIFLGLFLFSLRIPLPELEWIHLPQAMTALQTGGLMFCLFGMQLMASRAFWPTLSFGQLLQDVHEGKTAAAILLLGLFIFNGFSLVAFSYWITASLGFTR